MVTVGTLVATVWLYIIVPKGFLPLQDTGLIFAVMEGGEEVSFTEMQRLRGVVETAIRKDPDVIGVVSVVGVTPINATPNAGRLAITLRPRDQRKATVAPIIDRLQAAGRADPRRHGVLPAGAGHPDLDAREPRAVPVHADRRRREGGRRLGQAAGQEAAVVAACCATSPPRPRTTGCG